MLPELQSAMGLQHGHHHGQPTRIPADDGAPRRAERARRNQRLELDQQRPGAFHAGEHRRAGRGGVTAGQEQRRRVGDLGEAGPGHLEHADLVGRPEAVLHGPQDAEMVGAITLEARHGVDHVFHDARTGDLPVLGDMADEDQCRAAGLGVADQALGRAAHLRDRAGRGLHALGPHGLDRIDHHQPRRHTLRQGGDDVLDARFRGQFDGCAGEPEALGPQPHLAGGLFAGNVDDPVAPAGQCGAGLHQQCRLADAGVAADQDHRSLDETAACHPVELGDAGGDARRLVIAPGQPLQPEHPAARPPRPDRPPASGQRCRNRFLGDGVPAAAGIAATLPAAVGGAAGLAYISGSALGHPQAPT